MIEKLDLFFEGKSKKDVIYLFVAVAGLIGFVIFYFIYPISSDYRTKEQNNYKANTNKLANLKNKKNNTISKIAYLTKNNKKLKLSKNSLHKEMVFFEDLVSLLDFAKFDKYKWSNYMKNIVDNAKEEGLELVDFQNNIFNDSNNSNSVNKKMEMTINLKGDFKNLIYYAYKYENDKELLRVNELNISDKGNYMIKFTLYGYGK